MMNNKRIVKVCPMHWELEKIQDRDNLSVGLICHICSSPYKKKRYLTSSQMPGKKALPHRTKKKIAEAKAMLTELDKRKEEIRLRQLQEAQDE